MTKQTLSRWVIFVLAVYFGAFGVGLCLAFAPRESREHVNYDTLADLVPLVIAAPAAWLGYCFSRRIAFLQHLRDLWLRLVSAVQACLEYTYEEEPSKEEYSRVMMKMSVIIDEVRGAFRNVGEAEGKIGLYPFEEIKSIRREVSELGFGQTFQRCRATAARRKILAHWGKVRPYFLREFERTEPTTPSSPYLPRR